MTSKRKTDIDSTAVARMLGRLVEQVPGLRALRDIDSEIDNRPASEFGAAIAEWIIEDFQRSKRTGEVRSEWRLTLDALDRECQADPTGPEAQFIGECVLAEAINPLRPGYDILFECTPLLRDEFRTVWISGDRKIKRKIVPQHESFVADIIAQIPVLQPIHDDHRGRYGRLFPYLVFEEFTEWFLADYRNRAGDSGDAGDWKTFLDILEQALMGELRFYVDGLINIGFAQRLPFVWEEGHEVVDRLPERVRQEFDRFFLDWRWDFQRSYDPRAIEFAKGMVDRLPTLRKLVDDHLAYFDDTVQMGVLLLDVRTLLVDDDAGSSEDQLSPNECRELLEYIDEQLIASDDEWFVNAILVNFAEGLPYPGDRGAWLLSALGPALRRAVADQWPEVGLALDLVERVPELGPAYQSYVEAAGRFDLFLEEVATWAVSDFQASGVTLSGEPAWKAILAVLEDAYTARGGSVRRDIEASVLPRLISGQGSGRMAAFLGPGLRYAPRGDGGTTPEEDK